MNETSHPVLQLIEAAISAGTPPTVAELRRLRNQADKGTNLSRAIFWGGVIGLNLLIWIPLPFAVPKVVFLLLCGLCLGVAILVPIVGLKKHRVAQEWLKVAAERPKKRQVDAAGKIYIDAVKEEGRSFINAEVELLQGRNAPDK